MLHLERDVRSMAKHTIKASNKRVSPPHTPAFHPPPNTLPHPTGASGGDPRLRSLIPRSLTAFISAPSPPPPVPNPSLSPAPPHASAASFSNQARQLFFLAGPFSLDPTSTDFPWASRASAAMASRRHRQEAARRGSEVVVPAPGLRPRRTRKSLARRRKAAGRRRHRPSRRVYRAYRLFLEAERSWGWWGYIPGIDYRN